MLQPFSLPSQCRAEDLRPFLRPEKIFSDIKIETFTADDITYCFDLLLWEQRPLSIEAFGWFSTQEFCQPSEESPAFAACVNRPDCNKMNALGFSYCKYCFPMSSACIHNFRNQFSRSKYVYTMYVIDTDWSDLTYGRNIVNGGRQKRQSHLRPYTEFFSTANLRCYRCIRHIFSKNNLYSHLITI